MSDNIRVLKMITGEELIGHMVEVKDDAYVMEKVLLLQIQPTGQGQAQVGLVPYLFSDAEGDCSINKTAVAAVPKTMNEDLKKGYMEQTSGIALATELPPGM